MTSELKSTIDLTEDELLSLISAIDLSIALINTGTRNPNDREFRDSKLIPLKARLRMDYMRIQTDKLIAINKNN